MMTATNFKVESGMQMLARLTKKPDIENCYPHLFKSGPKPGHIIEFYSDDDISCLLCDIICESLIPLYLGGKEAGIIIFNTDGKLNLEILTKVLTKKLMARISYTSKISSSLEIALGNLFIIDIYNATQLCTTIQTLDNVLMNNPNVSLILFDTLTAFYWSEQSFKIIRMDLYIKNLLRIIQNVVKDYKIVILYNRPKYFSSSKDCLENLEACCEHPTLEQLNYRIQIIYNEDGKHHATVRTFNDLYQNNFTLLDDVIEWL